LANAVPQVHLSVYRSWKEGKLREASEEWRKLLSLERIYDHCGSYTASIKGALEVLGTPVKRYVREPLVPLWRGGGEIHRGDPEEQRCPGRARLKPYVLHHFNGRVYPWRNFYPLSPTSDSAMAP